MLSKDIGEEKPQNQSLNFWYEMLTINILLQPCTEQFFLTLFNQFRDDMTLEMAKYIRSTQGHLLNDQSDLKSILAKDAIYNAAGLVSFNLYDEVRMQFVQIFFFNYFNR